MRRSAKRAYQLMDIPLPLDYGYQLVDNINRA
jgi:hypothetical protein